MLLLSSLHCLGKSQRQSENTDYAYGADMDENEEQIDKSPLPKCSTCYWADICMLTTYMRTLCGGPFKDQATHIKFWEENIKGK